MKEATGHEAGEGDGRAGVDAGLARFEYLQRWTVMLGLLWVVSGASKLVCFKTKNGFMS